MTGSPRFAGRAAFVTGAASGIGRATALRLASEGARIFACDVDKIGLDETVAAISRAGGSAVAHPLDVSDAAACRDAIAAAAARFEKLDVLCNIAGVMCWGHATAISEAEWSRVVAVNLSGVFFLCQAAVPHLVASRGVIVNMASAAGIKGQAYTLPYSVTKAAVIALTKCLALEFGKQGLRVVAVAPGGVKTALTAQTKFAEVRVAQERAVRALQESVRLSILRYTSGLAGYFEVLEAQQQLFPAEISLAQVQLNQLLTVVTLYRALGGGWQLSDDQWSQKP